ncbi:MAG TPA: hypothetical protein VIK91_25600 [Nannocystis sp.]
MILAVEIPQKITSAGPVEIVVLTEAASANTVQAVLDGAETIEFKKDGKHDVEGADAFSTVLPIFGTVDNGDHTLEVIAARGALEDRVTRKFVVSTPAAGVVAWERYGGAGSQATRLALDPEGRVYEGGALAFGSPPQPHVRLRDPLTGADVWPGGGFVLDEREGAVADLALTPDGRVWVAMNVREGNTWRARIALFEFNMAPTGIELEKPGATVTAIDGDGDGGCLAVGYAPTIYGDVDVLMFRIAGDGTPIASGHPWDYVPPNMEPHWFVDLAFDVVVDVPAGEAWIVGTSQGKHDLVNQLVEARGMLLRVDLDTLEELDPVIIAPPINGVPQSIFYGATLDPTGILVTGNECTEMCDVQRLIVDHYNVRGARTLVYRGNFSPAAFGSSIARSAHGTVLVAANAKNGGVMRGFALGLRDGMETFAPVALPGKGASGASAVAVGPYDWAFAAGQVTLGAESQAYVMRVHQ